MAQAKTFWLDVGRPGTRATVRQGVEHAISGKRAIIVHRDDNNAVEIRPQRDGTYDVTIYRSGKQHHAVKARTDEELLHLARRTFGEEGRGDRPPRTRRNPGSGRRTSYSEFGVRFPHPMPPGFEDTSWHNDVSPSMTNTSLGLRIWVLEGNPRKREPGFEDAPRYSITRVNSHGEEIDGRPVVETDSWAKILAYIRLKSMGRKNPRRPRSNPAVYAVTLDGRVVSGTETHNRAHAWKWADRLTKQTGLKHSVGLKVGHRKIGPRPKGRLNPRRNPGSGSSDHIAAFRRIVKNWQAEKVDGVLVDAFSASAIVQVYDALNETNRMKFLALPAHKMAIVAFKVLKA